MKKETVQQLDDLQPKRHIDVDTKILTRNDLNMSMKMFLNWNDQKKI